MTVYSTKVSAHYIARRQAAQAGGTQVDFMAGTVIVGDGNGAVPAISDLVAAGGVLHEVWRGQIVVAVTVNAEEPSQVDIRCLIPAESGGAEIGPFWVREFVITDENGVACVFGTTSLEKTTSAQGQISDLSFIAAIGESDSSVVILSAPTSNLVTMGDVQSAINANHPTAEEPLYATDTTVAGWLKRVFKIRRATQSPAQIGVERPATAAEFAAGAPANGASPWPWATLQQIKGALDDLTSAINTKHPTAEEPLYVADTATGGWLSRVFKVRRATQSPAQIGVERPATDTEFVAGAPANGASPWPWPTLQQIAAALDALWQALGDHAVVHDATLTGDGNAASPLHAVPSDGWGDRWIATPAIGFYDANTSQAIGIVASAADIGAGNVPGITFVPVDDTVATEPFGGTWQTVAWVVSDNSNSGAHIFYWKRIA